YLASGNFILGIGPVDGDAAEVLQQTQAGHMIDRENVQGIKDQITTCFLDWKEKRTRSTRDVGKYTRKYLTGLLEKLL
ncbi:MAG: hypothetical protein JNK10_14495, partial [Cyclobacteriaceae bacterium]|nr:hypothetical protein [Cyclobacteriaceae bacterium]